MELEDIKKEEENKKPKTLLEQLENFSKENMNSENNIQENRPDYEIPLLERVMQKNEFKKIIKKNDEYF